MPSPVSEFEKRFSSQEMKDQFKWATNLEVEGNEAAYISFINCLMTELNLNTIKELNRHIEELKQNQG